MLRLLLVRHGQTEWNAARRYQGQSDPSLDQAGMEQARRLSARLAAERIDVLFCSDLQRALGTAQILAGDRDLAIRQDVRLRELNFGILEGHTFDEGLELWPAMISTWVNDPNQPPTGGERMDEFAERVAEFLEELRQDFHDQTVLVVAHGGPLRVIIQSLLESPADTNWWFSLDHCGLTDFQLDEGNIVINRLNDTGHLANP